MESSGQPYLLGLRLGGRRVVVIGGGSVAARRIPALLDCGARVHVVSPAVSPGLQDLAAAGRISLQQRESVRGDCAGAWLVCACNDDHVLNTVIAEEAERA